MPPLDLLGTNLKQHDMRPYSPRKIKNPEILRKPRGEAVSISPKPFNNSSEMTATRLSNNENVRVEPAKVIEANITEISSEENFSQFDEGIKSNFRERSAIRKAEQLNDNTNVAFSYKQNMKSFVTRQMNPIGMPTLPKRSFAYPVERK